MIDTDFLNKNAIVKFSLPKNKRKWWQFWLKDKILTISIISKKTETLKEGQAFIFKFEI